MLEPLSPRLTELLRTHGLCTASELRRCRRKVKRLTADLPAFDSVWIDALVSQKSLTPYQATLLESEQPEQIGVGDYVLIDRLGGRFRSETFLARTQKRKRFCVKSLLLRPEQREQGLTNLQETVARLAHWKHPHVVPPLEAFSEGDRLVVVNRYVPGLNLRELLVRRGRFPTNVVLVIARQILSGLRALRKQGVVHGDLRLENIKISPQGRTMLVETGIQTAITPQLSYVTDLTGEQCEGIAPERVASGRLADEQSDLYAMGCLLWQLLAGRPPIKEADPLAKLTAHQQRDIPDVREWAPDVPERLAEAVVQLTRRSPDDRPDTFANAAKLFGRSTWNDQSILREYQAYFLSQAPGWTIREQSGPRKKWPWMLATTACLLLMAIGLQDEGARNDLLSLASRLGEQTQEFFTADEPLVEEESVSSTLLALPAPDAEGVIQLRASGEYLMTDLSMVGPLKIVAAEDVQATLVVEQACHLSCESLLLERVRLKNALTQTRGAMLVVQSLDVSVSRCVFDMRGNASVESATPSEVIGLAWKSVDPEDRSGGRFRLVDSVFAGGGSQLYFATSPAEWTVENCLSVRGKSFARFQAWPEPERPLAVTWTKFCVRECGSTLLFNPVQTKSPVAGEIRITATNCVWDMETDQGAFFLFQQDDVPPGQFSYLSLVGEDCVASESLVVAGRWDSSEEKVVPLEAGSLRIEGVVTAPMTLRGDATQIPAGSEVEEVSGPRLSTELPGISADRLPAIED